MLVCFKTYNPVMEKKLAHNPVLPRFASNHIYQSGSSVAEKVVGELMMIVYYCLF
jgi:hypothetical protein